MSERPCGDITCWCCYPEFRHDCEHPLDAEDQSVHPCPDCGAVWVALRWESIPEHRRARMLRSHEIITAAAARCGHTPPAMPQVSFQQLTSPTRIPGSA